MSSVKPTSWCGAEQQAGAFPLSHSRIAAISSGAASCSETQVVEAEHQQRVGVRQHPLVDRQPVARLVDALEHRDRMAGHLADHLLEASVERWNSSSVPAMPCRKFISSALRPS